MTTNGKNIKNPIVKARFNSLVAKAGEVESAYNALTESQKRTGYLLVYTKVSKEIAIEHVTEHAE